MTDMTESRVMALIEAYGPEPSAWPEDERDAARALLKSRADVFADALQEARLLDSALSSMPEPSIPAGLAERIIASAPASQRAGWLTQLKSFISIGGQVWPAATAMASTAFGLVIGYGAIGSTQIDDIDYAEEAVYAAFEPNYDINIGDLSQ